MWQLSTAVGIFLPVRPGVGHDHVVLSIGQFEHGVARRQDAAALLGEYRLRAALREGVVVQLWRGVVVDGARALDPVTRATAAILACGPRATISHRSAAGLHGCTVAAGTTVHVTVPYGSAVRSRSGLVVHHGDLRAADSETLHGLPVTVLDHAVTEVLCGERPRWIALACLDQALAGRGDADAMAFRRAVAARLAARDSNRGIRVAEALLSLGTTGADSPQESRLRLLIVDAGFPVPETQHRILNLAGVLVYKLDIAWPELMIGVEFDGFAAHEGREEYDAERDRRLAARGWRTIRVRKADLANPGPFLAELRRAFAQRGARLSA